MHALQFYFLLYIVSAKIFYGSRRGGHMSLSVWPPVIPKGVRPRTSTDQVSPESLHLILTTQHDEVQSVLLHVHKVLLAAWTRGAG